MYKHFAVREADLLRGVGGADPPAAEPRGAQGGDADVGRAERHVAEVQAGAACGTRCGTTCPPREPARPGAGAGRGDRGRGDAGADRARLRRRDGSRGAATDARAAAREPLAVPQQALDARRTPPSRPMLSARAALLADLDTGQILDALHVNDPRPIASITKIMTALLIMERMDPADVVVVDPRAVFQRHDYGADSTLGLRAGERITVEDLLYGLLLGSANDAASALAIAEAGSETAFVGQMNARAHALGMRHTSFRSVHGLDDRGHSTAADLLRLVRAADRTAGFDRITATRQHTIPAPRGPARRIQNRNALLWLYPGSFGTKTGTTGGAGACLVASAQRDGRRLVAIVLGAPHEPFSDAASLLDYGFEGFTPRTIVTAGDDRGTVAMRGGAASVVAGAHAHGARAGRGRRHRGADPRRPDRRVPPVARPAGGGRRLLGRGADARRRAPGGLDRAPAAAGGRSLVDPGPAVASAGPSSARSARSPAREGTSQIAAGALVACSRHDGGRERPVRTRGRPPPGGGARPHDHRGLRRAGARARLGPEGRRDVPRGPDPRARPPRRDPLHGHQPVRGRRGVARPRADPPGRTDRSGRS